MSMKSFIILFLFILSTAFAQENEVDSEPLDGLYPDEMEEEERLPSQDQTPIQQVECVCPQSEIQAEEASEPMPSIFAPGTVFNVTPGVPAAPEKEEQEDIMPGQVKDLPPDYSNDTYYPAGVMPVKKEEE